MSKNLIGKRDGCKNGRAKSIIVNGINFDCIKDAAEILNISRYKINKLLEKNND